MAETKFSTQTITIDPEVVQRVVADGGEFDHQEIYGLLLVHEIQHVWNGPNASPCEEVDIQFTTAAANC